MNDDEMKSWAEGMARALVEVRDEVRRLNIHLCMAETVLVACCVSMARDPAARTQLDRVLERMQLGAQTMALGGTTPETSDQISAEAQEAAERLAQMIRSHLPPA